MEIKKLIRVLFVYCIFFNYLWSSSLLNEEINKLKDQSFVKKDLKSQNFGLKLTYNEKIHLNKLAEVKICMSSSWKYLNNMDMMKTSLHLTNLILKEINLKSSIVSTKNWADSLNYIKEKKCDIIPIIHPTKERMKYINFTSTLITYPIVLVTKNNIPNLFNFKILKNKKIAIISKNAVKDIFDKHFPSNQFVYFKNIREGINAVKNEEVFGYIDAFPLVIALFKDQKNNDVKINRFLNIGMELSVGVRNDDNLLFSSVEKGLKSITSEQKDKFLNKLFYPNKKDKVDFSMILQVLIIFFALTTIILYWHFELKRRIKKALQKNRKQESLLYNYAKQDAMKDLVGNISHQWKQPVNELSSVLFYIETKIQLKQKITNNDIRESCTQAREIINYLTKTVNIFSSFYDRSDNQEQILISELIKQAIFITEGSFQKYYIKIDVDIKNENLKVKGEDFQQVILAIFNNIKNIVIERKIPEPLIKIRLYEKNDYIILTLKDNCSGIKIDINNIFKIGTTSTKNGTGLGLYISKRIIEDRYLGSIKAKNKRSGALFKIKIPFNN